MEQVAGPRMVTLTPTTALAPRVAANRLGYVDSLRALAALYVVACHIGKSVWPWYAPSGPATILANALGYGHYAVGVFIVLSGFSLMLPVARNGYRIPWGVWGFYWRRARRILPPFYFAIGFSLLLIWLAIGRYTGTFWDISLPVTWTDVAQYLLLISDFSLDGGRKINFVFWSIAVECQIYVILPALVLLWRRYSPLFVVILVVALSQILMIALLLTPVGKLSPLTGSQFLGPYIGLFAMGMFAASVYTNGGPRWSLARGWYLWDSLALIGSALIYLESASWPLYALDICVGLTTATLLLAAGRPGRFNPLRAGLEWRPLVWIGGFSYSLYLVHAPLIQLLWQYVFHPLGLSDTVTYLVMLLTCLPVIVAAAWGFWFVCERPFLNSRPASTRLGWLWPGLTARMANDGPRL